MSQSKFTPLNVVMWCCVLAFVATTIAGIAIMFFPEILKLDDDQKEKLFTLFILEIVVIAVAVFAKQLATKKAASKIANDENSPNTNID